jgi:hypothetical protein
MLWYNCQDIIVFILSMFLVSMFIIYFDYMLSIVSLSLCLCISSYSIHRIKDPRVGGIDHVSVVLICYLPMNIFYILGHVVDRGCDTTIESFVVHSPNIGRRSRARLQRQGKLCSRTPQSNALMCRFNDDLSSDY